MKILTLCKNGKRMDIPVEAIEKNAEGKWIIKSQGKELIVSGQKGGE